MESRISGNEIIVPIGTTIGFKMIDKNGHKIDVKFVESEENSKFFAIFGENDVDFQIEINNRKCIHGIGYTLVVNNGFYDYYIGAHEFWTMEALYSRGRKLHFINQNSESGQTVVSETAKEMDISYAEAAAVCSRIQFNFEVEAIAPKPPTLPMAAIKSKKLKSSEISYHRSNTSFGSTSFGAQYLGRDVPDSRISAQSLEYSSSLATNVDKESEYIVKTAKCLARRMSRDSIEPFEDKSKIGDESEFGDKGVVCFGDQSNQLYNTYGGFTKDNNLVIKPFVVELRLNHK